MILPIYRVDAGELIVQLGQGEPVSLAAPQTRWYKQGSWGQGLLGATPVSLRFRTAFPNTDSKTLFSAAHPREYPFDPGDNGGERPGLERHEALRSQVVFEKRHQPQEAIHLPAESPNFPLEEGQSLRPELVFDTGR